MSAKRSSVDYLYSGLNWDFIKAMAEIAAYAATPDKYGAAEQYTESRLEGDKSPMNHIAEHTRAYFAREPHDHFGTLEHQLAAAAYNCMLEFYYLRNGGPTTTDALYRPVGTYIFVDGKAQDATPPWDDGEPHPPADLPMVSEKAEQSIFGQLAGVLFPNGKK